MGTRADVDINIRCRKRILTPGTIACNDVEKGRGTFHVLACNHLVLQGVWLQGSSRSLEAIFDEMRVASLFTGAGGTDVGLAQVGLLDVIQNVYC